MEQRGRPAICIWQTSPRKRVLTTVKMVAAARAAIHSTYNLCGAELVQVKSTPPSQRSTSSATLPCKKRKKRIRAVGCTTCGSYGPKMCKCVCACECVTLPRTSLALTHVLHNACFCVCVCLRLGREQKRSASGCIQTKNVQRSRNVRSRAMKAFLPPPT